jgi:hypothetical protein
MDNVDDSFALMNSVKARMLENILTITKHLATQYLESKIAS